MLKIEHISLILRRSFIFNISQKFGASMYRLGTSAEILAYHFELS